MSRTTPPLQEWTHDALAQDLAGYLRGMAKPMMLWLDLQLGPAHSMRPDVFAIEKTYTALRTRAFEVKVSRADFFADVSSGKALGYRKVAGALIFAAPKGLLARGEIPEGCGLIERADTGWRWARKPVLSPVDALPNTVWLKLLIDGIERTHDPRSELRRQRTSEYHQARHVERSLGAELAKLAADKQRAKRTLLFEIHEAQAAAVREREAREAAQRTRAARMQEQLKMLRDEIATTANGLGLAVTSELTTWDVRRALARLRPEHDAQALEAAARHVRASAETTRAMLHQLESVVEELTARTAAMTAPAGASSGV